MRSALVAVTACCACAALAACEDLGGLRGGDDDAGITSDAGAVLDSASDAATVDDGGTSPNDAGDAAACDLGPVANGLAVYLPFDEGAGVLTTDCGPSKVTAAIGGTKTFGPGRRKGALVFDGTSTCVSIEGDPPGLFAGAFTASAWVNVTSFPSTSTASIIVGRTVDSNEDGFRLAADQGAVFNLKVGSPLDAGSSRVVSGVQSTSTWRHVAAVYEPGVKSVLYVEGSVVDTETSNVPALSVDVNAVLKIGCGSAGSFFSGSIDDVRIYARALSPVEVALLASP